MPIDRLPKVLRPVAYRVRDFLMTDATALIILGAASVLRGIAYLPSTMPPPRVTAHPAEGIIPFDWWAVIWIVVGILCLIAAFWRHPLAEAVAIGVSVGLQVMWGISFVTSTLTGENPRSWTSAIGYFSVAALVLWAVWRGKRGDIPIHSAAIVQAGGVHAD